jgi:hypothetical protein
VPVNETSLSELVVLASAGCGLVMLSGLRVIGARWPLPARLGGATVITVLSALGPLSVGSLVHSAATAGLIILVLGAVAVASSSRTAAVFQTIVGWFGRSSVRAGVLATVGAALAAGAFCKFELEDQAAIDRDSKAVDEIISQPSTRLASEVHTITDLGRPVRVRALEEIRPVELRQASEQKVLDDFRSNGRIIRLTQVDDSCNCHGWVFTGGRYWVSQIDVEYILVDNGYEVVTDPRPGDLAIYRDAREISHTGVVRAVVDGMPPLVEGKWGWMGVFLHPAGDSMYGTNYKFYRSHREGHLLAGLQSVPHSKEAPEKLSGAQ